MVAVMRANGEKVWRMGRANCITLMEISMRVTGSMTRPTVKELIFMRMEPNTLALGVMISSMVLV